MTTRCLGETLERFETAVDRVVQSARIRGQRARNREIPMT